ncbi:galactose mutarotase isoform X1 [Bactrocera dorsalis]|uniref:Aldose 1-epimerase n=1 Tax=Bactrocera dorsalis TaxID=27457 RepID=A0A8N4KXK5_BACDO|nr:galactose mutarotase isoform X1 [Bactrocera dorsalis]XP_029404718.2 galactose mutarotase isoform X1 [Bactrocera dorsalis]
MVCVTEDAFGTTINPLTKKEVAIRRFTITNDRRMSMQLITFGASITSLKVPDSHGMAEDITLGFDNIEGYLTENNPYIGCSVGRVCSRVGNGNFILDGKKYEVTKNFLGKHMLHGGTHGFSKVIWEVDQIRPDGVVFKFTSPDGHEGFPGEVVATATYTITDDNCMRFCFEATTNKPTPVNMTNHAYFNLAGHNAGKQGMAEHIVKIKADCITDMDEETVPNGQFISLENHPLDLRKLTNVGEGLRKISKIAKGYDHNYVLKYTPGCIEKQAKVFHPPSGRCMEILSNQPCMHFYTAHNMPDLEKRGKKKGNTQPMIIGKGRSMYEKHGSFCMETHWFPDAVNHANFPSVILSPGDTYQHVCLFRFGVYDPNCERHGNQLCG